MKFLISNGATNTKIYLFSFCNVLNNLYSFNLLHTSSKRSTFIFNELNNSFNSSKLDLLPFNTKYS